MLPTPSPGSTPVPIPRRTRPSFRPPPLRRENASLCDWTSRLQHQNSSQAETPPRSIHGDDDDGEEESEGLGSSQESRDSQTSSLLSFGSRDSSFGSGYGETPGTSVEGTQATQQFSQMGGSQIVEAGKAGQQGALGLARAGRRVQGGGS